MSRRTFPLLVSIVALAACAPQAAPAPKTAAPSLSASASPEEAALDRLFKDSWEAELASDPMQASMIGDRRWNDKWADLSLAALERTRQRKTDELRHLHAIPRAALSEHQKTN